MWQKDGTGVNKRDKHTPIDTDGMGNLSFVQEDQENYDLSRGYRLC